MMRIFIGASEVANFIASYKQGFEEQGFDTFTVIGNRNPYYPDAHYDVVLSDLIGPEPPLANLVSKLGRSIRARLYSYRSFFKALFTCDVFIYNTGGCLLPWYLDYKLIKFFRKRLVVVFLGSEIRHWYPYQEEMEQLGRGNKIEQCVSAFKKQGFNDYIDKMKRISAAEQYADLILSQAGHGQLQTRPYMRATVGLNLNRFQFHIPDSKVPLVLHAPSSRGIKGTAFVLAAVERLRSEGVQFEFRLIENMPNAELIELLSQSDILVDELNSDTVGVLSTEAMASGNAVLTSYLEDYAKVPHQCPAINVYKDNIYECLRKVIIDRDLRRRLAREGRAYVEKHHDVRKITKQILDWLEQGGLRDYDFTPTFYKTLTIPMEILVEERKQARKNNYRRLSRLFKQ